MVIMLVCEKCLKRIMSFILISDKEELCEECYIEINNLKTNILKKMVFKIKFNVLKFLHK
jgi:hypothetical protein